MRGARNNVNEYPTVGGASYSYDGNANLTGDGTWGLYIRHGESLVDGEHDRHERKLCL